MKNNNEVTFASRIKIASGTIELGTGNIKTKNGFILKSPENVRAIYGDPIEYIQPHSRTRFKRRG